MLIRMGFNKTGCFQDALCGLRQPESRTWARPRRVIAKVEHKPGHEQRCRFLVTSLDRHQVPPRELYEDTYCPRGDMENRIKDCQLDLFANRMSAHANKANQLRLLLAAFAYVLIDGIRRVALKNTTLAKAVPNTIRLKLLKLGAKVINSVRRIKFPPAPPPEVTLRPLPSPATGLPRLPVSPSLRAVPTTPADRNGCIRRLLPRSTRPSPNLRRVGVHIFTFEACSGFTRVRPARSLNRPRRPLSQGFGPAGYPTRPPVSYQIKPTTVWVDPSSTGVTRHRGALRYPGQPQRPFRYL